MLTLMSKFLEGTYIGRDPDLDVCLTIDRSALHSRLADVFFVLSFLIRFSVALPALNN